MKRFFCLVALLVPGHAVAQVPASPITADELAGRLRFFSSDLFLGRRPGTAGEALTTSYLVSELSAFGLRPGVNGSWFQAVSIVGHEPVPDAPVSMVLSGRVTATWRHGADLRVANHSDQADVATGGDLVFIGYGITAPVYRWDDLARADLTGKIAVGLLGEPDADSTIFNGVRASRYSWTRDKEADLERRGAVGVLWIVPAGRMSKGPPGGSKLLAADAGRRRLLFTGTVADSAVAALVPGGAAAYAQLVASAGRRGFSALPLGSRLEVRFRTRPWAVTSNNVVATVPGTDQVKAREHIVLSAHWDAYGITSGQVPDSIYNGALDDGSGTTELLALARVFAGRPEPRSITFLFATAEEWGLLGAEAFVCGGPLSPAQVVANLNLDDGPELFGLRRDVAPLGVELSSLGADVDQLARTMGYRVTPDPLPAEGFFLRADNYPFARAGVPALYLALGTDGVGHPKGWIDGRVSEYLNRHYHAVSDDYDTVVEDIRGAVQLAEFTRRLTVRIARAPGRPAWRPGAEFARSEAACGR